MYLGLTNSGAARPVATGSPYYWQYSLAAGAQGASLAAVVR